MKPINLNNYDNSGMIAEIKPTYTTKVKASERKHITSSGDAYNVLKSEAYNPATLELNEYFVILLLNRANKVLGWVNISQGGMSGTVTDVRLIMAIALQSAAQAIILSHNHPSGNVNPSNADLKMTNKIKDAGELMDIPVLDHLIVTKEGYYSFADEGII